MYYVFFIYAFINGHSDYFHILAKINNAAVNLGIQIFLQDSDFISFISMPRSGIINHQMVLFLISWGFLSCLHQFTSHQGASFLRIFPRVPLLAFKPSRYEMISDCIFKNNTFFFKRLFFFWCGPFLKSLLNLLRYHFRFMFWFSGHEARGILTPWVGIELAPPALGRQRVNC